MLRVKSGSVRGSNLNFVLANISIKSEPSLPSASPGGSQEITIQDMESVFQKPPVISVLYDDW